MKLIQIITILLIIYPGNLVFADNGNLSNSFQLRSKNDPTQSQLNERNKIGDKLLIQKRRIEHNSALVEVLNEAPSRRLENRSFATWTWRILKSEWTESDEKDFEEFVRKIGESQCRTTHSCLTNSKSNPAYHPSNPRGVHFYADCADLPYVLRSYFAWKNGLPFSYSATVRPLGRTRDIRYTARGNSIYSRRDLVQSRMNAPRKIRQIVDTITSVHFRIPPNHSGTYLSDHYLVNISRKTIKPGTIIYDVNGHVAVVYKVTDKGRIHYIDTHPDNSLTRGIYGRKFARSNPSMGGGFKRWGSIKLVRTTRLKDGSYSGGSLELSGNDDLENWSDEQYYGNTPQRPRHWRQAKYVSNGKSLNYYDFVRIRLASEDFKYNPIDETRSLIRDLCEDVKYRVDAVDLAIKSKIHKLSQPNRLPRNIYGTEGNWEIYSTPSRDARLKTSFKELRDEIARFLELAKRGDSKIDYEGDNLRNDLARIYSSEARICKF